MDQEDRADVLQQIAILRARRERLHEELTALEREHGDRLDDPAAQQARREVLVYLAQADEALVRAESLIDC